MDTDYFECTSLKARISVEQCRSNRTRPLSASLKGVPVRHPGCIRCTQWREVDPPLSDAETEGTQHEEPDFEEENIFNIPIPDKDEATPSSLQGARQPPLQKSGCRMPSQVRQAQSPCASCRYFRPLPTYHQGVEGVRLCWADHQSWDFSCYREEA